MLGTADRRLVVLHHHHRVALGAKPVEGVEEQGVVARVQPDGGLVEDVAHAPEVRAELRREADALRFAAAQRRGGAMEGDVAQPHLQQEVEPRAELGKEVSGDCFIPTFEREALHPGAGLRDREASEIADCPLPESNRPRFGPQPVAAARAA